VHAVFLEEPPLIGACYDMTAMKNIVLVPLFIGEGSHVDRGSARRPGRIRRATAFSPGSPPAERSGPTRGSGVASGSG